MAFCDERCFPCGVDGPRERAPLAREDRTFLIDDIASPIPRYTARQAEFAYPVDSTGENGCDRVLGQTHGKTVTEEKKRIGFRSNYSGDNGYEANVAGGEGALDVKWNAGVRQ